MRRAPLPRRSATNRYRFSSSRPYLERLSRSFLAVVMVLICFVGAVQAAATVPARATSAARPPRSMTLSPPTACCRVAGKQGRR